MFCEYALAGHAEGPHDFNLLLVPSTLIHDPKRKGKFWGLKNSIFQSEIMQFHRISRTGEAVQGSTLYTTFRVLYSPLYQAAMQAYLLSTIEEKSWAQMNKNTLFLV